MKRSGWIRPAMVVAMAVCAAVGTDARAQFVQSATGISNPVYTVTFDEHVLPTGAPVTTQFQDVGVTFAPELFYALIGGNMPNITGRGLVNSAASQVQNPFSVKFTVPRTSAALALATAKGTVRFTARLNGAQVATALAGTYASLATNFFGFTGITFDEIVVERLPPFPGFQMWMDHIQLGPEAGCYPDCDGSTTLTVADFACFQTKFVAGDPYADCNGAGGLTIADFGCFQTEFVAGCP